MARTGSRFAALSASAQAFNAGTTSSSPHRSAQSQQSMNSRNFRGTTQGLRMGAGARRRSMNGSAGGVGPFGGGGPRSNNNGNGSNNRNRKTGMKVVSTVRECRDAIASLRGHARIAVDCEGVRLSRTGRLCLLQIASPDCVYVFDILSEAGTHFFTSKNCGGGGLNTLLEDPKIVKVVHDCRYDADALMHQFGVRIAPVLDTQVAFSVLREARGLPVGLPVGLRTLLKKFAGLSDDELVTKSNVKEMMQNNDEYWQIRPLSEEALKYAKFDVEYLLGVAKTLLKYISGADKKHGIERVMAQSEMYSALFRDNEDGPRKAQQQYETMARVARRERAEKERERRLRELEKTDPLRKFAFEKHSILNALGNALVAHG